MAEAGRPVLALDIGGTKTLACLVAGPEVLERVELPTARDAGPEVWLSAVRRATASWDGRHDRVGAAVTGVVRRGRWSAPSPDVLPVPEGFPLEEALRGMWGVPAQATNDAQAAAWGEYRFGAGCGAAAGDGAELVFVTVSTGVGGGVVAGGRLLGGLAGHVGSIRLNGAAVEARAGGLAIAAAARRAGRACDAREVFARATEEPWAERIVGGAAGRIAALFEVIRLALDPGVLAMGGGVGLAPGFLERVRAGLAPGLAKRLVPAKLGADAGVVGAADLARSARAPEGDT